MPTDAAGELTLPLRRRDASTVGLDDNLAVYDDVGQLLILLNTSAAAVWERCDGTTPVDDMVHDLAAAHGADAAEIAQDVRQTVAKLAELGLVVEAGAGSGGAPPG
ncbi:MAG: PqqD family protein [Acidimicrobiales bacterium]